MGQVMTQPTKVMMTDILRYLSKKKASREFFCSTTVSGMLLKTLSQPNMLLGRAGERSCGRKAPRYVLGAYWRGNLVLSRRKTAKKPRASNKDGTRVETSCEADDEVPRAEAIF